MLQYIPARFRTPRVARAMTSPSAIVLTGLGAAAAIASGLPLVVAPIAAVAGYALRVGVTASRERKTDEVIDPFSISEPWRTFVRDAQTAKSRFDRTQRQTAPGPLKDRLGTLGDRIGVGVSECWRIARHADALQDALQELSRDDPNKQLAEIRHELGRQGENAPDTLRRTEEAVAAQVASYERMKTVADDARNKLRLLNAQLDEAVARAVEMSINRTDAEALNPLSSDIENVVSEMENLRQAIEVTDNVS